MIIYIRLIILHVIAGWEKYVGSKVLNAMLFRVHV
jgi:hypothetical protein